eukprot:4619874-Pyramimonas_sp.AAC.1
MDGVPATSREASRPRWLCSRCRLWLHLRALGCRAPSGEDRRAGRRRQGHLSEAAAIIISPPR